MSHDLDKYRSLYETVEVQLQSKNKEIEELKSSNTKLTDKFMDELKKNELQGEEVKQLKEMEGKILSLSHQLREREEEVKQLSTDIKDLQFQNEKNKSMKEMSDKVVSFIYLSLVQEVSCNQYGTAERERRVKWDKTGKGSVTLTSPTRSDCITLIRQLIIDTKPCEEIRLLNSSSTKSTLVLLSLLHVHVRLTNIKKLEISNTEIIIEHIHCLYHLFNINHLEYLRLEKTSLSTSGGLHLLTDAISTNTSLGVLELWNDDRLTEDDMMNISKTLTINTTLQRLHLCNCNITYNRLEQLSNGLTQNKTLTELDISYNNLITSTTTVCDIIHNSSLTHLNLRHTSLPSDSIPQLLDALSTNNTIQRLVIDGRHKEKCKRHENYQHIKDRLTFFK